MDFLRRGQISSVPSALKSTLRISAAFVVLCGFLSILVAGTTAANAQLTSLPFASTAAGLAPGTGAAICSAALDSWGDGCPATQASITASVLQAAWTDRYGNVYFADWTTSHRLRVIYHGGSPLAAIIAVNNPTLSGSPQAGYVYSIAGGTYTASLTSPYYCNGTSGTKGLDAAGNGCPAYEAYSVPTGGDVDADGDIFLADHTSSAMVRVIYAGGTAAATLIKVETGVTLPVTGSIYRIGGTTSGSSGYQGDGGLASSAYFRNEHSLVVDSNENLYIADYGNNVVRRIDGTTGIVTSFAGGSASGCVTGTASTDYCPASFTGDSGSAASATLSAPYDLVLDANGNVYIADGGNNRVRVVYAAGTLPGISNPVAGSIYTIAGGGTSTTSGVSALNLQLYTPQTVGVDPSGNIYVGSHVTTRRIYRIDAQTGIATAFAGNGTTATTVGGYCSGSTGPTATDTVGDGCPATQAAFQPESRISFAPKGVAYIADVANGLIRAFTFNQLFPATAVGSTATLPIAVTSPSSFVAPSISATVQGTSTGEFAGSSTDCTAGTSYAANAVCTYNLTFTPTLPGRRAGEYVLTQSGTTVATQGLEGDGLAALLAVGSGTATKIGASIANVQSITTDMLGNLYVSDASTGTLWKMAGASGSPAAILTGLNQPAQAAIDGQGNIYVADTGNNQIVELTASGTQVSLLTGLKGPNGVAVTGNGTLYVADTGNNRILSYVQGVLSQLPITGLSAPSALALDASDDLFIADTGNQRVVEYAAGTQSTVSFGSAEVEPAGVAVDPAGDVYIADKLTSSVLRMVSGASTGAALAAGLTSPSGIGIDGYGDIFYADSSVAGLNEVVQQQGSISFANTNYGESSAAETATVANIGNASLSFTSSPGYTATGDTTDFSLSTGTGGCGTASLALAATCTLEATFTPGTMNTYTEAVSFQTSAVNTATAALNLSGQGINLISTTTSIAYSPSSPVYGNTVTLTITITPTTMNGAPTGSIAVTVDGVAYQTINVAGTTAQITISSIGGTHVITATYSGDTVYASSYGSTSFTVSLQPTTTVLTYATNLAATSATLTLTAQITPGISGQPTGTVSFYSGSTLVGTVAVSAQETAVYSTTTTSYSSYTFTAVYSGDSNYATSSSGNLTLSSDFGVQQSGTTINAVAGYPVDTTVTLTSYFNYTGNLTFSCSGLPANTICRFQPTSVSLTPGASTSLTMEVFTNVSSGVQTSGIIVDKRNAWLVLLVLLASLGMVRRIARVQKSLSRCLLPVLLIASALACTLTGCSSSTQFNATTTPAGTSTVVLTVADGAGHSHTATYTLTITQQQ